MIHKWLPTFSVFRMHFVVAAAVDWVNNAVQKYCILYLAFVAQRRKHSDDEHLETDLIYMYSYVSFTSCKPKSPFIEIHWSLSIQTVLDSCLLFLLQRVVVSTLRMMRSNNKMHKTKSKFKHLFYTATTIITNYNRFNHISSSRLIFFIICLLFHIGGVFFLLSICYRYKSSTKEWEREREKK